MADALFPKLSKNSTKQERLDAHKVKMEAKKQINAKNRERYKNTDHLFANLSKNHPHYGDTPQEHARRKMGKNIS